MMSTRCLFQLSLSGLEITEIRSNGLNTDYGSFSGPVVNNQLLSRLDIESAISNQTIKNKGDAKYGILATVYQELLAVGGILLFRPMNTYTTRTTDAVLIFQTVPTEEN